MFERIKMIHGREYRYLVSTEREGCTVKQKVVKYIGPVDPVYKKGLKKKRESNAWLFVQEINTEEMKLLEKAQVSPSAFTRDRARIILQSMKGMSCNQIAEKIGCEARKVRNAIKAFNQQRLKALNRGKAPGAKRKLSKEQKVQVLMIAATEPKKLNLHFTTWSLQKLQQYLMNQGVVDSISIETIRCLLKQERMKLRKSKRFQYSNDPLFAKKNSGSTR
jgi:transposase